MWHSVTRAARAVERLQIRHLSLSSSARGLYLGLDSSTQGLKVTAIDNEMNSVYHSAVNFDKDLPQYGTQGGFHEHNHDRVTAPTLMFADALDMLLSNMKNDDFNFAEVLAVSGSGQQHGSVYFGQGARGVLQSLRAEEGDTLAGQLANSLSIADSPIWRDSSTTAQCRALEEGVGGAQNLANITGSRAYERFTGSQIMKIAQEQPQTYQATERISLISSFMCSLLLGDYAAIDTSDGAGMNMMDLAREAWSPEVLEIVGGAALAAKMGDAVPAHTVLGSIAPYFTTKYGFSPDCHVIAWSGDNPNSVAGLGLRNPGDVGLSLGTSDTIFSIVDADKSLPGLEGHLFMNPVDPKSHMAMLCYKNGSLARETVRDAVANGSWDTFNDLVQTTPVGNGGHVGLFIDTPEIIPYIATPGTRRFDPSGAPLAAFPSPAVEARAVLEGQMLSMRMHSMAMGLSPKVVIATGGGSANAVLTQIIADVFGAPVLKSTQTDSASLGAALRALHGFKVHEAGKFMSYAEVTDGCPAMQYNTAAVPSADAHAVYNDMLGAYKRAEDTVVANQ